MNKNLTRTNNRLSQIIAEIQRLNESLDYNKEKLYSIIKKEFDNGKHITINNIPFTKNHYITPHDELCIIFSDIPTFIPFTNITNITIKEKE